jgi:tRNA threonylcarbamoyladenosine biosynthesis protein TsaB
MAHDPLLLAVESATVRASVALLRGESLLAEVLLAEGRPVSETLLAGIDAALGRAGLTLERVEAFAVSIGPGSFTGLRVGLATVKGLAFASERPVAAVPTLAALARGAGAAAGPVAALLDAQRGEVYAAGFRDAEAERPLAEVPEALYTPERLAELLPRDCLLVGEGAEAHARALGVGAGRRLAAGALGRPRAFQVGVLGARLLRAGAGRPAAELVPRYLRRAEAEARRTGQPLEPDAAAPAGPGAL